MSRVVMMCGPAGSGKSTVARRLESEGMTRLSVDAEAWRRGIRSMPIPNALHHEIERALRSRLVELVSRGVDVVLDFSFWSRQVRMEYRDLLRPLGVEPETVYLATTRTVGLERISARKGGHSDDYPLSADLAKLYFDHFEPPSADEGPLTIISEPPL